MCKHLLKLILLFAALMLIFPSQPKAENDFSEQQNVFRFLKEAFHAQVSLSEEGRTLAEVNELLRPYFTDKYKKDFLKENLVSENGEYFTLGSDAAQYYIPFFSYSDDTKVILDEDNLYVFEFFPESDEGPVSYESHYEGVKLVKAEESWKVSKHLSDRDQIPEKVIQQSKKANSQHTSSKQVAFPKALFKTTYELGFYINPFDAFIKSGSLLLTEQQGNLLTIVEGQKQNKNISYY